MFKIQIQPQHHNLSFDKHNYFATLPITWISAKDDDFCPLNNIQNIYININLPATSVATIMFTSCFLNFVITLFLSA